MRFLLAAAIVTLACKASAQSEGDTNIADWSTSLVSTRLPDGSLLNEYQASSRTSSGVLATLVVGFHPRFQCEPVASLHIAQTFNESQPDTTSLVRMFVDGEAVEWLGVYDEQGGEPVLTHGETLQRRQALLDRLDRGSRAVVNLSSDLQLQFSLLGSRRAAVAARQRCQAHRPIEWTPER